MTRQRTSAESVTPTDRARSSEMGGPKRAVFYLRVSTAEQAMRGGEVEGYSLPAQRDAATAKATALHAVVADEFVERGESARTAKRPELQRMLRYVADHDVDCVIIHKVDRLARSI